jgi:hypothetical protein
MTKAERRYLAELEKAAAEVSAFIEREKLNAEQLIHLARLTKQDLPDDVYRAAAYFVNSEWKLKKESLVVLITASERLEEELPRVTKETAIDQLRYRFRIYTQLLEQGGW